MPDILVLTQEAINDLASGKVVSCPCTGGKILIMSQNTYKKESEKNNEC